MNPLKRKMFIKNKRFTVNLKVVCFISIVETWKLFKRNEGLTEQVVLTVHVLKTSQDCRGIPAALLKQTRTLYIATSTDCQTATEQRPSNLMLQRQSGDT